jgi:hypothetical protein
MQNGSSGTLIGWKSGLTTSLPLWDRIEGSWLWTPAATYQCKNVIDNFELSIINNSYFSKNVVLPFLDIQTKHQQTGLSKFFQTKPRIVLEGAAHSHCSVMAMVAQCSLQKRNRILGNCLPRVGHCEVNL